MFCMLKRFLCLNVSNSMGNVMVAYLNDIKHLIISLLTHKVNISVAYAIFSPVDRGN